MIVFFAFFFFRLRCLDTKKSEDAPSPIRGHERDTEAYIMDKNPPFKERPLRHTYTAVRVDDTKDEKRLHN